MMTRTLIQTTILDGVLAIDKPADLSSFAVVHTVRKLLGVHRVGHAGTLDPCASGLLLLLLGQATKLSEIFMEGVKEYRAEGILGLVTESHDLEGAVLHREESVTVTLDDILAVLPRFMGHIEQLPPMFSAVHCGGKRLYELAREGKEVARESRSVYISNLELLAYNNPIFTIRVECSKGTYIRSLVADIGDVLGTGACVQSLVRTRSGAFSLAQAVTLEELRCAHAAHRAADLVVPLTDSLQHLPALVYSSSLPLTKNRTVLEIEPASDVAAETEVHSGRYRRLTDKEGHLLAVLDIGIDKNDKVHYSSSVERKWPVVRWLPRPTIQGFTG